MVNNAIVAVSLGHCVEDPVILRVVPHGGRESRSEDIGIISSVEADLKNADSTIWILRQPRCQREACSATSDDVFGSELESHQALLVVQQPYGGLHQKSWTTLVPALALLSKDSPVVRDARISPGSA